MVQRTRPKMCNCTSGNLEIPGSLMRPGMTARNLLRQTLLQPWPARIRVPLQALRIGGKGVAVLLAAEQIEPLSRNQPEPGVARNGSAASQIDRLVAAELGAVNIGMGDKGGAVALVAETRDRAGVGGLEARQTDLRAGIDKIGDGVKTLDRQTGIAVHHHPFGGRGPRRIGPRAQPRQSKPCQSKACQYKACRYKTCR